MFGTKFKKILNKFNTPRVILVRHGTTDLNNTDKSEDRIRGWIDVPLNAHGMKDGEKARDQLKDTKIDQIFSSDLIRAIQTARIINEDHKVPIMESKSLRPWNLGVFQGKITDQVIGKVNEHIKNEDEPVPDGESFRHFRNRYIGLLDHIIQLAIKRGEIYVVTTHLRNLKLCDGWVQNGMPSDYTVNPKVIIEDEFTPGELYEVPIKDYMKRRK